MSTSSNSERTPLEKTQTYGGLGLVAVVGLVFVVMTLLGGINESLFVIIIVLVIAAAIMFSFLGYHKGKMNSERTINAARRIREEIEARRRISR